MNPDVLFWGCVVLAFLAGAGVWPIYWLFRYGAVPPAAAVAPPVAAAAAVPAPAGAAAGPRHAAPITSHHGYDTMDVLAAGWEAGQGTLTTGFTMRACNAAPAGVNAPADWRCVKPAGHAYSLHENAEGGAWGDNTFTAAGPAPGADGTWEPDPERHPYPVDLPELPDPYAGQLPTGGAG